MEFKKKILRTIKEQDLFRDGDHLVLGFSGGPDSLALFYSLLEILRDNRKTGGKYGLSFTLHPVHVNHKMRPGAAEEDQAFCEEFCRKLSETEEGVFPLIVFTEDCNALAAELKITSEEAGRLVRYRSFRQVGAEVQEKYGCGPDQIKILVAQNMNDQAETVLFRILRGTGTDGLSGIASKRTDESGYSVIRPLLNVSRREIEAYIEAKDLEPRRDLTNDEAVYTRNKIRLELIPFIEERFNPNVTETLSRLADVAREDKEYLHDQARSAYEEACTGEGRLDLRKLEAMMPALRSRVYMAALKDKGLTEDVTLKHLKAIDSLRYAMGHGCAYTELPGGYRVMRVRRELVFFAPGETNEPG